MYSSFSRAHVAEMEESDCRLSVSSVLNPKACLVSTFLSACLEALEGLVSMYFSDASSYVLPLFLLGLF